VRRVLVVAAFLAACSSPGEPPPMRAGQVVVAGDATLRTRDAGAIEVSVRRAFRDKTATGMATLHGLTLDAAQRSPLIGIAATRAWLTIATTLADEPAAASEAAERGLDELGIAYRGACGTHHVIDDSGLDVLRARQEAERGNEAGAAAGLITVLRTRLDRYLHRCREFVE
jgi:hypothetical protein